MITPIAAQGDAPSPSGEGTTAPLTAGTDRVRFAGLVFRRLPSGLGSAQVTLEWKDGRRFVGKAEGVSSSWADLRLAVEATIKALAEFSSHRDVFELVGVKSIRAFDANVIMVSVMGRREGQRKQLVGCRIAEPDPLEGAVLATLQATNRLIGPSTD